MREPFLLREQEYRGHSFQRLFRIKSRILAGYLFGSVRNLASRKRKLRKLSKFQQVEANKQVIVCGMGPSLRKLNYETVAESLKLGILDLVVVNHYDRDELSEHLVPSLYVLSDPAFFESSKNSTISGSALGTWDYIRQHRHIRVFIPDIYEAPADIDKSRVYYFNSLGLEGFTKNVNPLRPRGHMAMTAHQALAIAGFLGYAKIFIIGIENTEFKSLRLGRDLKVRLGGQHSYDEHNGQDSPILPLFRVSGVAGFFEDVARKFKDFHLFSHLPIENLDTHTLIDAFPPVEENHKYLSAR